MALSAGLRHPVLVEHNGISYLVGYRNGQQWIQRYVHTLKQALAWSDGATEKAIGPSADARAGFIKMESQGRRLLAAIPCEGRIDCYVSDDDGATWIKE